MGEDMPATTPSSSTSQISVWPGRIISALVVIFLLFDSTIKVLKLAAAGGGNGSGRISSNRGSADRDRLVGVRSAVRDSAHLDPRGHLADRISGRRHRYHGAHVESLVSVSGGGWVLAWLGISLRDERLRTLLPLRTSAPQ
jgi:hypothetical protein